MDTRPKTSRGIPAYGSTGGVSGVASSSLGAGRLSTEDLLKRASLHLRTGQGDSQGSSEINTGKSTRSRVTPGQKVTSSYDATRKVRSSTETYLNNLSRKATKVTAATSDDDEKVLPKKNKSKKKSKSSKVSDGSSDEMSNLNSNSSTSTLGKGGSMFLKKKASESKTVTGAQTKTKNFKSAVTSSRLMSSSDENERPAKKLVVSVNKDNKADVLTFESSESSRIELEGADAKNSSLELDAMIKEQLSTDNSTSAAKKDAEEYDDFDESPPKTPVSARKEVRFSTQLSIASGEENMSVVESVMDTESLLQPEIQRERDTAQYKSQTSSLSTQNAVALSGTSANSLGTTATRVPSMWQDSDLGLEVNLDIENILPAIVKPDKTLPPGALSDSDNIDQNVLDINELEVAPDSPIPVESRQPLKKQRLKRLYKRRKSPSFRRSSATSTEASENEIVSELESHSNDEDSAQEQIVSIGKLQSADLLVAQRQQPLRQKSPDRKLISVESVQDDNTESKDGTEEEEDDLDETIDSRPDSRASFYSQDSFEDASTTNEAPYSSDHAQGLSEGSDGSDVPRRSPNAEKGSNGKRVLQRVSVTSYDTDGSRSDATTSFPTYTSKGDQTAISDAAKMRGLKVTKSESRVEQEDHRVKTLNQKYFAERETAQSIDRVFHQIVTVQPKSIASMVVDKDTIDTLTTYNPSAVALTSFMRSHLNATRAYIENARKMHEQYQSVLIPNYAYTTLESSKKSIEKRRVEEEKRILEAAIDEIERRMGEVFSDEKRDKIRLKVLHLKRKSSSYSHRNDSLVE